MAEIEEVAMTSEELYDEFYDEELCKLICQHVEGRSVMVAYVTLCTLIGTSIGRTSRNVLEIQHAMDMCGQIVANAAQAEYEGEHDNSEPSGSIQ